MKTSRDQAAHVIQRLLEWGAAEFYVCAGARNVPLVETLLQLQSPEPIVFNHFEERCAAFYALGRIKSIHKPVVVVTTSGSAVGELLAPTMEAYYNGLPLVLLTADRPKTYRGKCLPQSAEQKNIFGTYVSACFDLDLNDSLNLTHSPHNCPLHVNVCFEAPLQKGEIQIFNAPFTKFQSPQPLDLDASEKLNALQQFLNATHFPLTVVGQINPCHASGVASFLQRLNTPVYLEPLSQLREHPELAQLQIKCGDKIWKHAEIANYKIDGVLKIGHTPTHRFWRDVEELYPELNVLSISDHIFPGHSRAQHLCFPHLGDALAQSTVPPKQFPDATTLLMQDQKTHSALLDLFSLYPKSEASFVYFFSEWLEPLSRVYLGNSLPVRHWDLSATLKPKHFHMEASRGINGIDGQLSTFLGFAEKGCENWAIVGDLTALYDLAAPWALQYARSCDTNFVIINNGGGKIFDRVLQGKGSTFMQNNHAFHFKHWAAMWNLNHTAVFEFDAKIFSENKNQCSVFEVFPDAAQTAAFNAALQKL